MTIRFKALFSTTLTSLLVVTPAFGQESTETTGIEKPSSQSAQLTLDDLRAFTDVFNQARKNYVETVDDQTLLNAAIRGMLQELDPHSSYLPAKELEDLNDTAKGRYSGIGIEVQNREGEIVVNAIINDSPADQAGINPDDVITAINGHEIGDQPAPEAMDELLGKPDSNIELTFVSPDGEQKTVTMTREYIKVPTLSFQLLDDSIGYFKMTQFHQDSAADLQQALESLSSEGTELAALVIDLRNNPGGILRQAVAIADGFLDEGAIVSTRGRNAAMQLEFTATPGQWLKDTPLMLLVDQSTASASEVLAGALQDNGRALIAGERTFGKGSVQSVLPLRNGAGMKLTTARYYTPSGRSIQAEGIDPDVIIDWAVDLPAQDSRLREVDLDRHLVNEPQAIIAGSGQSAIVLETFPLEQVLEALRNANIVPG
jgi:carboxyl-terminal processing protease